MNLIKNKFIFILILIAMISGSFWGFAYEKDPRPEFSGSGEAYSYDQKAVEILEQGLFSDSWRQSTSDRFLYPIFLAGVYKVFGHNYHAVTMVQIFLFVLTVVLVYLICQMTFNEKIARLAGIFAALCYTLASFSGWLYRETLFTFLVTLTIYCLYKAQITFKTYWFALSGLVIGFAFLTNTVIQFFILIIVFNFFIVCRKQYFRKIYSKVCIFFVVFSLIIFPLMIGGYISFGGGGFEGLILRERMEKMQSLEGNYLEHFIGNTLGDFFAYKWFEGYNPLEVRHGINTWQIKSDWTDQGKNSIDLNQVFLKKAKEFIPKHLVMYLEQSSIDFLKFNTPMIPNMRMQHVFVDTHPELPNFMKGSIILFIRLFYLIFFGLAIYAIVKSIRNWPKISWLFLIILYFNGIFSAIHAIARYSLPIYPIYIIFATVGLVTIYENMLSNK